VPPGAGELLLVVSVNRIRERKRGVVAGPVGGWVVGGLKAEDRNLPVGKFSPDLVTARYPLNLECPTDRETSLLVLSVYVLPDGDHMTSPVTAEKMEGLITDAIAEDQLLVRYGGGGPT
jgi:hypothetical protein